MSIHTRVAQRYAKALFLLAEKRPDRASQLGESLAYMASFFEIPQTAQILVSRVFPKHLKELILNYGLDKLEAQNPDKTMRHFIYTVLNVGRIARIPDIERAFRALMDEMQNRMDALVTSATKLEGEDLKAIKALLEQAFKKSVDIKDRVDPSLLGGFSIKVGYSKIDLSLKAKLESIIEAAVR